MGSLSKNPRLLAREGGGILRRQSTNISAGLSQEAVSKYLIELRGGGGDRNDLCSF